MSIELSRNSVNFDEDVSIVIKKAKAICSALSIDRQSENRFLTALSESVRNLRQYAESGEVFFEINTIRAQTLLLSKIVDRGNGIQNVEAILEGNYKSKTGMGIGLKGSKKLVHHFSIDTKEGVGTAVTLGILIPVTVTDGVVLKVRDGLLKLKGESALDTVKTKNSELSDALQTIKQKETELQRAYEQLKTGNLALEKTNQNILELNLNLESKNEELKREVDKRKVAEKMATIASEKAKSASDYKSLFLANMSHEIRTPLNAILGFSQILQNRINDENRYYIDGIQNSGKNLLRIINDILDISKIEAGQLVLEYAPLGLENFSQHILNLFTHKIEEKNIVLEFKIGESCPKAILIDETRLTQILVNLISNAVKFTSNGGVYVEIQSHRSEKSDSLLDFVISVRDTGLGIEPSQLEDIFEEFKQVKGQKIATYGGTGLGLSISKKLVEMMGGELSVESEQGKGSIFEFTLNKIDVSAVIPEKEELYRSTIDFLGAKLLIVEDIESNVEVVKGFLETSNIEMIVAENGQIGVDLAVKEKPDIILMDMQMPVMDGYTATQILKKNSETQKIPVVALTASIMDKHENQIKALCDGYLRKPVSIKELTTEMAKHIAHTKLEPVVSENVEQLAIESEFSLDVFLNIADSKTIDLIQHLSPQLEQLIVRQSLNDFKVLGNELVEIGNKANSAGLVHAGHKILLEAKRINLVFLKQCIEKLQSCIAQNRSNE